MNYAKLQSDIIKASAARDGYNHKAFPYQFGYFQGYLVIVYKGIVGFVIPVEHLYIDIASCFKTDALRFDTLLHPDNADQASLEPIKC